MEPQTAWRGVGRTAGGSFRFTVALALAMLGLGVVAASGLATHVPGCVPGAADPATVLVVDAPVGKFYFEERNGIKDPFVVPFSGFLTGARNTGRTGASAVYAESNGLPGLQRADPLVTDPACDHVPDRLNSFFAQELWGDPVPLGVLPGGTPAPGPHVVGHLVTYKFPIPILGGTFNLPCVVASADSTTLDPCAKAGGDFSGDVHPLVDSQVPAPTSVSVRVCNARLYALALGDDVGVEGTNFKTLC